MNEKELTTRLEQLNNVSNDDLGPLPEADQYSKNQRESIEAFNRLLSVDSFIFRDERADDYGVDGSLELLINSKATNLRGQIQLKSIESADENTDGSISVQVKTANLNYVLNGPSPFYVLYIVPTKQLRYLWASDERNRIATSKPEWMDQENVSLRFSTTLHDAALTSVFERIKREGVGLRSVKDKMANAALGEMVSVEINEENIIATTADEIFDFVTTNGINSVALGFSQQIVEKIGHLQGERLANPKVQLVRAYGQFSISKHYDCLGAAAEATRRQNELTPSELNLLKIIQAAGRFYVGKLDEGEFHEKLSELEEDGSLMQLQNRLETLKLATVGEGNVERKAELTTQLESIVAEIKSHGECGDANALLADISFLYVNGMKAVIDLSNAIGNSRILGARQMPTPDDELLAVRKALAAWTAEADSILIRASDLQHPMLLGDAASTYLTVETSVLSTWFLHSIQTGDDFKIEGDQFKSLVANAEKAIELYSMADNVEGELRCKMLLADLYELNCDGDKAQEIAASVQPVAEAFEFHSIALRSAAHVEGASYLQQTIANLRRLNQLFRF